MRLHSLRLQAFLAYPGCERIDFDPLSGAGLFLLQGPTGAGKSSILDAICFALYGELPGSRAGAPLRSGHPVENLETEVALEATIAGRRLRITRAPEQERPKLRGEGTTTAPHRVLLEEIDGETVRPVSTSKQEVGDELGRLLGMTREQFCQVVVLPQGLCEQVLLADTKDRDKLLRGLFDVRRFADVEHWLRERSREAGEQASAAIAAAREPLAVAASIAGVDLPELDPVAGEAPEWLAALSAAAEDELTAATAARDQAASAFAAADRAREQAASLAERRRDAERLTEAAAAACDAAREAGAAIDGAGADQLALLATELHERVAGVKQHLSAEADLAALVERRTDAARDLASASATLAAADAAIASAGSRRPAAERALAAAREAAARLDGLRAAGQLAAARLSAAQERDRLAPQVERTLAELTAQTEAAVAAHDALLSIMEDRIAGMAAVLAEGLADGEACVVCGSVEHPAPASHDGTEHATEAAVEQARGLAERSAEARDRAAAAFDALRTEHAAALSASGTEQTETLASSAEDARTSLEEAERSAAAIDELAGELRKLDRETEDSVTARTGALARIEALELSVASADREIAERGDSLATARGGYPGVREHVDALSAQARAVAAAHEAAVAAEVAAAVVPPGEATDLEAVEAAAAAREAHSAADRAVALGEERLTKLAELVARHGGAVERAVPIVSAARTARALFELTDGIGADNRLRMKLSAYVLAAKLEAVAQAASARLQAMSGGRYELLHSAQRGRNNGRGGLDLLVKDAYTGQERAPGTLSGGEKFCASLALALGLADVVSAESGGSRLETIFIDEGFGSLDDDGTLEDVLGVLDGLKDGGRVVGVVSHVRELAERIPVQLRVEKTRSGSRIRQGERQGAAGARRELSPRTPSLREELERALPPAAARTESGAGAGAEVEAGAPASLF